MLLTIQATIIVSATGRRLVKDKCKTLLQRSFDGRDKQLLQLQLDGSGGGVLFGCRGLQFEVLIPYVGLFPFFCVACFVSRDLLMPKIHSS